VTSRQQPNLVAALRYAEAGIPIFPAKIFRDKRTQRWRKKPHIPEWQTKATTDQAIIREWWSKFPEAVPAIALADVGLVAIDVDRHEGADGAANFAELIDGQDLAVGPVTNTAGGGAHYIFCQPETGEPLGNGRGDLPEGIDVRGHGGFIVAAGAVRPDGVAYSSDENGPNLAEAYREKTIPVLPEFLEEIIRTKRSSTVATKTKNAGQPSAPTARERSYALHTLEGCARELENAPEGERNNTLNAISYRMARMSAAGWINRGSVMERLGGAAKKCGLLAEDGPERVAETLKSGWGAGLEHPHPPLRPKARPFVGASTDPIVVRWAGSKDWPAPKWLVKDLIPDNSVGLIVGESQAGKSFVSVSLAGALAVGKPFFGEDIKERGGTVYVGAEASLTIGERLRAEFRGSIKPYLEGQRGDDADIDLSMLPIAVLDNVPDLANHDGVENLIGAILAIAEEMREKYSVPLRLVIVDTMVAAFGLEDWNSAAEARSAISALKKLAQATGAVVIGVHHHGKDKSRGATGSFVFGAAPDFVLTVHRKADEDGVAKRRWVALTKARSRETGWSCDFELRGEVVGGDEWGDPVYCPFVVPQQGAKRVTDLTQSKRGSRHVAGLRRALEETLAASGKTISFADCTYKAIPKPLVRQKFDAFYGGNSDDSNRKAFSRALKALIQNSEIAIRQKDGNDWLCQLRPVQDQAQPA
jgi:AAA domain/Bifunctional DNA primase/polymerase, N-terminal